MVALRHHGRRATDTAGPTIKSKLDLARKAP